MALTYGTAVFTSGQQAVTSVSLDSGTLTYFQAGTEIAVGANPQIATVEAQKATGASSFNLKEPWPYPSGNYAFLASNTSEAFANGVQAAKGFQDALQAAVGGQGTAASRDAQTGPTDATAGRVLTTGAAGILGPLPEQGSSFDDINYAGFFAANGNYTNSPFWLDSVTMPGVSSRAPGSDRGLQLSSARNGRFGYRTLYNGVFSVWKEFWNSDNFTYAQNVSGVSRDTNQVIAGSNLNPAQTGSWMCVSNGTVSNNGYGLWMRT